METKIQKLRDWVLGNTSRFFELSFGLVGPNQWEVNLFFEDYEGVTDRKFSYFDASLESVLDRAVEVIEEGAMDAYSTERRPGL